MGDNRRFDLFAKVVAKNFPPKNVSAVADIAGGKGQLQIFLRRLGYHQVVTFDNRKKEHRLKGVMFQRQFFGQQVNSQFDLLLGLHPDEATDVIIVEAARRRVPFVVCPCCVLPTASRFDRQPLYRFWLEHLVSLAQRHSFNVLQTALPMAGKSNVIIGRPR